MSDVTIRAEHLSKRYRRGLPTGEDRLSEVMAGFSRHLLSFSRRLRHRPVVQPGTGAPPPAERAGEFWALREVSFEVKRGEVFGVIGRNGAGKSTLLKVLSRITEPTAGRFGLAGRVGSLLEVGTGFHPELTGRENVFLNGTLLGMSRTEVRRKFDAIAEFAEIDDFLDTQVKRYSSGMQTRLGFAVAAHLEPEILIIDEVLAVGDANFQQKCVRKVQEISSRDGCTVLFVNHNLAAVRRLCHRALWLDKGTVRATGEANQVAARYLEDSGMTSSDPIPSEPVSLAPALESRPAAFPFTADFARGAAEHFAVRAGQWYVGTNGLHAAPIGYGDTVATLSTEAPLPSDLDLRVTVCLRSLQSDLARNANVLFDYVSVRSFAFIGLSADVNSWAVGRCLAGEWVTELIVPDAIVPERDYEIYLALRGRSVTLTVNGVEKLCHELSTRGNGTVGLASRNAMVFFKRFSVSPALAESAPTRTANGAAVR